MDTITHDESLKKEGYRKSFDREQLEAFIRENADFFDKPYKQGVFAVGILVRLLLNVQYRTLNGNTPFQKKLKGLNLNHESLMAVYVEALSKLSQFKYKDRNFFIQIYTDLRDFISDHFTLQSHAMSKISNNELSFYFVAGLEMGNKFRLEVEAEAEDLTAN
jgi:CRISPR-associated protein Csh1